jgi:hypothetical protein
MSASYGSMSNGAASSMGGAGGMSNQESRGTNGLLGMMSPSTYSQFPMMSGRGTTAGVYQEMWKKQEEDRLRTMLKEMGLLERLKNNGQGGAGGNQPPPSAGWAFPQYTQNWLPEPPAPLSSPPPPPFQR